jgi:hypothetical protein
VYRLCSSAFIGLPCPTKIAGIRVALVGVLSMSVLSSMVVSCSKIS